MRGEGKTAGDEPTDNLDSANTGNIVEIRQQLANRENRCLIIVTHDQAVADCADMALKMRDGPLETA